MIMTCNICNSSKPIEQFTIAKQCQDGRRRTCKDCHNAESRASKKRMRLLRLQQGLKPAMEQQCGRCMKRLPSSEFNRCIREKSGLSFYCKTCHATVRIEHKSKMLNAISNTGHLVPPEKHCDKCGLLLPAEKFYIKLDRIDKLSTWCKPCQIKSTSRWGKSEVGKESRRKSYATRDKSAYKEYREKNRERILARLKSQRPKYLKKHRDRMASDPVYALEHKLRSKLHGSKRRSMMNGECTLKQWLEILGRSNNSCLRCGSTERVEMDHVFSVSAGGSSNPGNLQPLCRLCNPSKGSRFIDYRAWTMDSDEIGLDAA